MKILHYFLGFPPYRTGGMTKFAYDLMRTQLEQGSDVVALWPGQIKLLSSSIIIKPSKVVEGIKNFEIINPLPISYDEGIANVVAFTKECNPKVYETFLKKENPDAIHIHTLMGLHKEFVEVAKRLGIKTVYTTHDFFPICPKVTLYRNGMICDGCIDNCPNCNSTALSLNKIVLLQEPLYRKLKDSSVVKQFRKKHRSDFLSEKAEKTSIVSSDDYKRLRDYYLSILKLIDVIHFNSEITKNAYEKYLELNSSVVVPITHKDIQDRRSIKQFGSNLRLSYLGPGGAGKGFFCLRRHLMICGRKDKISA